MCLKLYCIDVFASFEIGSKDNPLVVWREMNVWLQIIVMITQIHQFLSLLFVPGVIVKPIDPMSVRRMSHRILCPTIARHEGLVP